jgi:uncharacterized membrane protein YfcA
MMLQSAYFSVRKQSDELVADSDRLCSWLCLDGVVVNDDGTPSRYGVIRLPWGASLMLVASVMSGLLGVGAGALKVAAMDYVMKLPLKVSTATSTFMIGNARSNRLTLATYRPRPHSQATGEGSCSEAPR